MGRPPGRKNVDFDKKRRSYADALAAALDVSRADASLHQLAEHIGTTPSQLRHYFGDRDGAFEAAAVVVAERAASFMGDIAKPRGHTIHESLLHVAATFVLSWRQFGVGAVQAAGLAEGLVSRRRGRAYVDHMLEPTVRAVEQLLASHPAFRGDARLGALAFLGPLVLALLHQDALDGHACRPLDLDRLVEAHVDAFVLGWCVSADRSAAP